MQELLQTGQVSPVEVSEGRSAVKLGQCLRMRGSLHDLSISALGFDAREDDG